ncbi:MAG: sigma-70 family RNA polymerase sigma factor [Actinobacteria bacterium]|nr:sigma-70 family RNA polymerase sigma factor [Actinomycetota bacterium]
MATADLTSVALRAGRGDELALEVLVERTVDDVRRYCAHMFTADQADDLTQATYLRALRSLPSYRGDSSARTWLIGIARHVCLDEMRSRQRRGRLVARLKAQPQDTTAPADTGSVELREAIDALAPDRREAFVLTQLLGFPYEDAAGVIGCPVGTIRSRVSRARTDLLDAREATASA